MIKFLHSLLLLFIIQSSACAAKDDLVFDKRYFECENQWIVLPKQESEQEYMVCYLYLDRSAGFTLKLQGDLTISPEGKYIFEANDESKNMIFRIPQDYVLVAILPEARRTEMNIPAQPDWVKIYREGEDDTDQLIRRGWHFNHVGASGLALSPLLKAYKRDAHAEGLEFELAYAYNAEGKFDKAIEVLNKALKKDPKNYMFFRELGYAYLHIEKVTDAEKTYKKGISLSDNRVEQSEMAFNMAGHYFKTKNKKKFDEWAAEFHKYADKDMVYYEYLEKMQEQFGK